MYKDRVAMMATKVSWWVLRQIYYNLQLAVNHKLTKENENMKVKLISLKKKVELVSCSVGRILVLHAVKFNLQHLNKHSQV